MTISAGEGPLIQFGQEPPVNPGAAPSSYNADRAPSLFDMGLGLLDPRFGYSLGGAGGGSALAFGFSPGVNYVTIDQVPSLAAVAVIAAGANPASGTPMVLVSSTGGGVTVMTAALFIKPTGLTVPACLALDGLPAFVAFGTAMPGGVGSVQVFDPTTMLARAVSVTGVSGGSGGAVTVRGYDVYGNPQSEIITLGAGVNTVNSKKAYKFVVSVTPGFSDTHAISIGTADVYGLPLRADAYGYVTTTFNNVLLTTPTFVAAVVTTPTSTSGDPRGTIVAASDGTKRLQVMQGISVANLALLAPGVFTGLYGPLPFTS